MNAPSSKRRLIQTSEGTRAAAFAPIDWANLVVVASIWGASFVFIDIGLDSLSPWVITFGRVVFGFLTLRSFPSARRRIHTGDWPRLALLGLTWSAIPFTLFPIAQQHVDSALAGMLNALVPIFSTVVASLLLGRAPGWIQALGIGVGFVGAALISSPALTASGSSAFGVVLIVCATFLYGLSIALAVPLQQRYGGPAVLTRSLAVAAVVTAPLGIAGLGNSTFRLAPFAAVVALGVLGTGVAYISMTALVGRVGPTRGGVAVYFVPVGAIVLGVVLRGDTVTFTQLIGTVVVLVGAALTSRREDHPALDRT